MHGQRVHAGGVLANSRSLSEAKPPDRASLEVRRVKKPAVVCLASRHIDFPTRDTVSSITTRVCRRAHCFAMRRRTPLVVTVVTALCAGWIAPAIGANWAADIDYLASQLPQRHPDPFQHVTQAEFNASLAAIKSESATLSDVGVAIRIQEAIATLRDAHTELDTRMPPLSFYPLRLYAFQDGLYVTRTSAASSAACGTRLLAVNGIAAEEVFHRVSAVISAENDAWLLARVPSQMVRAEVLEAVGIASVGAATFSFESTSGARFDLPLYPIEGREAGRVLDDPFIADGLPLYMQHSDLYYWYDWDPGRGVLYLQYNVCADDPSKKFESVAREMSAIVASGAVETFVIDLRNNGGGSSEVLQPLIDAIPQTPQLQGRVFAIIGRRTFSSAMLNAVELRDAGAVLVGENSGGKPNSFGEVRWLLLPNSGLKFYYSTRFIHAVDGEVSTLEPSIGVGLTSDAFFARRDPVLEAILNRTNVSALSFSAASVAPPARRRAASSQPQRAPHVCF